LGRLASVVALARGPAHPQRIEGSRCRTSERESCAAGDGNDRGRWLRSVPRRRRSLASIAAAIGSYSDAGSALSLSRCSLGRLRPMLRSRLGSRRIGRVSNSLNLLARAEPVSVCTWPSKASVRGGMAGRPLPPHRPPLSGFFNGARVSVPAGGEDRASHRLREDGLTTLHTLMNPNVSWNHRGWDIETLSWYDDLRGVCYWGSQMQERGQHGRRGGCVTVGMTTWTVTYKRQYRRSTGGWARPWRASCRTRWWTFA
jgi:hypothetical protein